MTAVSDGCRCRPTLTVAKNDDPSLSAVTDGSWVIVVQVTGRCRRLQPTSSSAHIFRYLLIPKSLSARWTPHSTWCISASLMVLFRLLSLAIQSFHTRRLITQTATAEWIHCIHRVAKIIRFYFDDNFGKGGPIFVIFFTVKFTRKLMKEVWLKTTTSRQICCRTRLHVYFTASSAILFTRCLVFHDWQSHVGDKTTSGSLNTQFYIFIY